jgi:ribonuclease Z
MPLCSNPQPSLLVHEATDSTISPETDDAGRLSRRQLPDIMKTTLARGHSTPIMAGEFAKLVDAQKLVLNHIGSR